MELMRERSVLSIVMMVALVATSFLQLHASRDLPEQDGNHAVYSSSSESRGEACCDDCFCIQFPIYPPRPPQCYCSDVKPYCHPSCKACACNWSQPPQCQCLDVKDHCDKKCTALRLATEN